jgi:hypothetical protein
LWVHEHTNDHSVEAASGLFDDVHMSEVGGIKRSRVQGGRHAISVTQADKSGRRKAHAKCHYRMPICLMGIYSDRADSFRSKSVTRDTRLFVFVMIVGFAIGIALEISNVS